MQLMRFIKRTAANRGVIIGGIIGGMVLGWLIPKATEAGVPFVWQLVVCMAFGAVAGLVIGLVYRRRDARARSQQQ